MREKLIRGGIIILIFYLVVSFIRDSLELRQVEERLKRAKTEVEELEQKHQELEEKKRWVESEGFTEEEIRNKLNMAREGETVVILPEEEKRKMGVKRELEESGQRLEEEGKENWRRWVELF